MTGRAKEPGNDSRMILRALDPETSEAGYWEALQRRIIAAALPELARRRALAPALTVEDVVVGWARTLVPTALVAAALAGILLFRGGEAPAPPPMGIEELLVSGMEGSTFPAVLGTGGDAESVLFTLESF